jgi:hypothetical protein
VALIDTIILSVLGLVYRKDFPHQFRTYLPTLLPKTSAIVYDSSQQTSTEGNRQTEKGNSSVKKLPIIKACVSSFSVENGQVIFEVIVYKNGKPVNKLKKQHHDFLQLDNILDTKYAKFIRDRQMFKGILPLKDKFNFDNIRSIELFKTQLNNYLAHLSNEKHNDSLNASEAGSNTNRQSKNVEEAE